MTNKNELQESLHGTFSAAIVSLITAFLGSPWFGEWQQLEGPTVYCGDLRRSIYSSKRYDSLVQCQTRRDTIFYWYKGQWNKMHNNNDTERPEEIDETSVFTFKRVYSPSPPLLRHIVRNGNEVVLEMLETIFNELDLAHSHYFFYSTTVYSLP